MAPTTPQICPKCKSGDNCCVMNGISTTRVHRQRMYCNACRQPFGEPWNSPKKTQAVKEIEMLLAHMRTVKHNIFDLPGEAKP